MSSVTVIPKRILELGEQLDYLNSASSEFKDESYWHLHDQLSFEYACLAAYQRLTNQCKKQIIH